jgi:hypothetical protein
MQARARYHHLKSTQAAPSAAARRCIRCSRALFKQRHATAPAPLRAFMLRGQVLPEQKSFNFNYFILKGKDCRCHDAKACIRGCSKVIVEVPYCVNAWMKLNAEDTKE